MLRQVELSVGRLPDPTWKRPPGRPRAKWTDQLRRHNNNVPTATLWRQAIGRGHSRATLRSEPTTRYRRRQRPTGQPFGCYRHSKHIGSQVTGSGVLIFIQAPTHRCNVVKSWHKGTQVVTLCFIRPMCYTPLSFVSLPFPFFRFLPFPSIFFPLHPVSTFVFSSFLLLLSFCIFSFSPVLIPSVSSHFDGKSE